MSPFEIVLVSLWIYPLLSLFLVKASKGKPAFRKYLIKMSALSSLVIVLSLFLGISTTNTNVDWWLFMTLYFSWCTLCWMLSELRSNFLALLSVPLILLTFFIGYFSSTVGALGVGFIISEYEASVEKKLSNTLYYKEFYKGSALSDYRDLAIQIIKTPSWLPFVEIELKEKYYNEEIAVYEPTVVSYDSKEERILLFKQWTDGNYNRQLRDTIYLNK